MRPFWSASREQGPGSGSTPAQAASAQATSAQATSTQATSAQHWEAALQKQMQGWRADPHWEDEPPQIDVTIPAGSFVNMDCTCVLAMPPDAVFDTIADPNNQRVFKNIRAVVNREVIEDDGRRQVVDIEQLAIWRFLFLSGTFSVNLRCIQERDKYKFSFQLRKPGFMKLFTGFWQLEALPVPPSAQLYKGPLDPPSSAQDLSGTASIAIPARSSTTSASTTGPSSLTSHFQPIPSVNTPSPGSTSALGRWSLVQPIKLQLPRTNESENLSSEPGPSVPWYGPGTRIATKARVCQEIEPALLPPPWLAHYLRGITVNTTLDLMRDFQAEAARLRFGLPEASNMKAEMRRIAWEENEEGEKGAVVNEGWRKHGKKQRHVRKGKDFASRRGGRRLEKGGKQPLAL